MMHAKKWGFVFSPAAKALLLGECISPPKDNSWMSLLEEYHGIRIAIHEMKSAEEALALIRTELKERRPVLVDIDEYWCPWRKESYRQAHARHNCLVTGFDATRGMLYCIDAEPMNYGDVLPLEHYASGYGPCTTFAIIRREERNINWRGVIRTAVNRLRSRGGTPDAFTAMRDFATVAASLDLYREMGEGTPEGSPLCANLLAIGRGRILFSGTLRYLAGLIGVEALAQAGDDLKREGGRWRNTRDIFIKAYQAPNEKELIEMAIQQIRRAADEEARIAEALSALI
jgi:hypothetical protein